MQLVSHEVQVAVGADRQRVGPEHARVMHEGLPRPTAFRSPTAHAAARSALNIREFDENAPILGNAHAGRHGVVEGEDLFEGANVLGAGQRGMHELASEGDFSCKGKPGEGGGQA